MPDEDEAQAEEQLKTPEQTTITLPPGAPKKPALAPIPPAPAIQTTRETKPPQKARDIQAAKTSGVTLKVKKGKSLGEDTNYQWPDDGVFRGIHPDSRGTRPRRF